MFLHSQEQQPSSLDIYKKRKTVTAIAPALLEVAVKAMLSQEVLFVDRADNSLRQDMYVAPAQDVAQDTEAQILHIRELADKARTQHGIYDYPAEDITDEVAAFRKAQNNVISLSQKPRTYVSEPEVSAENNVIQFPDRILQANPDVDNNRRQTA